MSKKKIAELAEEILNEFLPANGYELYNIEFVKVAKDRFLRVYIDWDRSAEGRYIGTEDCEKVSRFLSERLDELDPIEENYYLEVCSPGLDRVLLKEKDYLRHLGSAVDVSLYKAVDGRKKITGTLTGLAAGKITITDEKGNDLVFLKEQVAKTKLKVIF